MRKSLELLYYRRLLPERDFHIFSRSNGQEQCFYHPDDRHLFLRLLKEKFFPLVKISSYSIQINHFHLVIKTKSKSQMVKDLHPTEIASMPAGCRSLILDDNENVPEILSNRMGGVLNSYSQYYNLKYKRKGSLFSRPFCRKWIHNDDYLKRCIFYTNGNDIRHGVVARMEDVGWSGYNEHMDGHGYLVDLKMVYDLFGGKQAFEKYHLQNNIEAYDPRFDIEIKEEEDKSVKR